MNGGPPSGRVSLLQVDMVLECWGISTGLVPCQSALHKYTRFEPPIGPMGVEVLGRNGHWRA